MLLSDVEVPMPSGSTSLWLSGASFYGRIAVLDCWLTITIPFWNMGAACRSLLFEAAVPAASCGASC